MNERLPRLPQVVPPQTDGEDVLDLRQLVDVVRAGRWTIALFLLLGLAAGTLYCWAAPPMYRADALVQVEKKTQSVTGSTNELYELISGRDPTSTEIELIKSRLVIGRVVDQLQLNVDAMPRRFPLIGGGFARHFEKSHPGMIATPPFGAGMLPLDLGRYAWGGERIELGVLNLPEFLLDEPLHLVADGNDSFRLFGKDRALLASGRVGEPTEFLGGAAHLFVRELIANPGTEFLLRQRHLLEVVNALTEALEVRERGKLSSVLSISLERSDPREVTRIVNAIANVYQRQNVERRSAEAEQTLIFINEQLPRVQKDLEVAENAFNSYRLSQKSADLTKETELVLQQSVELEQQRLQLQQKREEALRKFTAKHPVMQALDGQLQQIEREQNSLLQRVKGLPETQQELLRLSRDVEVNNALYTALLSNAEQLRIAKAGTIGNVRIVDSALQPYKPSRPDLSLALPLSGVLGAFFGLILVFVRNALHRGIADPAIIERRFCLPVFATIPHSPAQRKIFRKKTGSPMDLRILAAIDPSSPAIEAIRSLRTALHVSTRSSTGNVMMVCGPSPSLGKSFVSANLSASLAMAGRSVALVDADLRRGQLHQSVGLDRKPGLTDALTERCEFADVVHATGIPNLSIVPTGPIPSNPAELLLNPGFDRMISWLSERFEHVVIDTAPVLIVSDAVIAGRCAATALLVLKSGQHSLREIDDSLKRLRAGGIGVNGIVLNEVGRNQLDRYGSETGYYNYNYKRVDSKKEQTA